MKMPAAVIREEISKSGAISFARFMELALYCPETGYYERKKDNVGRRGDFITSVSVGSLFGELLAFQFAEWLAELPAAEGRPAMVEAGAHDARLARDILTWLGTHRAELFDGMEYVIVEPSPNRRRWQEETLAGFSSKVRWVAQLAELKPRPVAAGVIFSNELLDAFPVHRFGWSAAKRAWFEWGVALSGDEFCWSQMPAPALPAFIAELPAPLLDVLPDNYVVESDPAAEQWWRDAAEILVHGKLVTVDYGYAGDEIISPARHQGTLRAYHQHQVSDDLLANVGEQDLTAHVNFSALQKAGEAAGLRASQFCTQPQFLTRILQKSMSENSFAALDMKQVRQFQTLTHPDHLGHAFRVLVQER